MLTARPTTYKGIKMRSRLEASFAEWLDGLGRPWQYEPACFADETGQYLPDFLVTPGGQDTYFEVKPTEESALDALPAMHRILASVPDAHLIATWPGGQYPDFDFLSGAQCEPGRPCGSCERLRPIGDFRFGIGPDTVVSTVPAGLTMLCPRCDYFELKLALIDPWKDGAGQGVDFRLQCGRCESKFRLFADDYHEMFSLHLSEGWERQ